MPSRSGWIEETAIESAELVDGELRFEVPLEITTLSFRARAMGGMLIGMFDYNGQWYPFVVKRGGSGSSDGPLG